MNAVNFKEIGKILRDKRKEKNLTLEYIADELDISINYMSQLERGDKNKNPSDPIIIQLSEILGIDEKVLFEGFGRLPASLVEEIKSNSVLLDTLYKISNDNNLTNDDRNSLYNQMHDLYLNYINKK
ncbi:hypothetical protein COE51_01245 [Bacillus pseudomycoides]|nr:hypothetical protein COE51_01245 [Bacillus pseudomycoides]